MKETEKKVKPFGFKDKLAYMLGDIGNDFPFQFTNMYLMIFYTKVWGVNASIVGLLFLISRILDAFTDITMGTIIDKCNPTKDGKFRPWIKRMAGPFAIATFLMYQSSLADASMTVKIVVMFATYILWGSICYTGINIPYGSMASAITEVPSERTSLSTWRNMGASVAGVIIGSITPQIIYYADASGNQLIDPAKFTMMAGIFSILSFICWMLCYFMTTERVKYVKNDNEEKVSVLKNIGSLLKNKALLTLIVTSILILLCGFVAQTMNQYLFADYFKNINALSTMSIIGLPIGFIVAMFATKLSSKFGKKEITIVGTLFAGVIYTLTYFLKIENPWIFIGLYAVIQVGVMFFNMLTYANITDVVDYSEIITGKRDDATVYALYSFSRKLGQALAGGFGGFALSMLGYNSLASIQTTQVTDGIYAMSTLFPGVVYILVAFIFMFAYPLSKKVVEENAQKLAEMRKNA